MADASDSRRLQAISKIGLVIVAIALVLTLVGAWFASSQPVAAIDQQKFENYHDSLQSYTHESLFVAQQYEHQRALANYTAVTSQKIYDAVSDLDSLLQTESPEDGLKAKVQQAADQAAQLQDVLSELSKTAEDGGTSHASTELNKILAELKQS